MKALPKAFLVPLLLLPGAAMAQKPAGISLTDVITRVTAAEHGFLDELAKYRPLVETYIQFVHEGPDGTPQISDDAYFIGNFEFRRGVDYQGFNPEKTFGLHPLEFLRKSRPRLLPGGFAQMAVIDNQNFGPAQYDFENPRGEFLGEVRCIALDVKPKPKSPPGRFVGRIWVEDRGFHVVRYSGTYTVKPSVRYFHFNSYRQQIGPGLWLPSLTYIEDSFAKDPRHSRVDLKGHVRFWSYNATAQRGPDTFTDIFIEAPQPPKDVSAAELSRTEALREWQHQAEENTLQRMEKAGLVGPTGEVENVLDTVLNNLIVTNKVAIDPPVRTRILLTTPLETFTVGRTILLSRGLIDVLPTEASLGAVIARELAGVLLGFKSSTVNAFSDRMLFEDQEIFRQFSFRRTAAEDLQANRKAIELLKNSPYAAQLPAVGLFLRALAAHLSGIPNQVKARIGNPVAEQAMVLLLPELIPSAPELDPASTTQIAALPLASRIRLDPWKNGTGLIKAKPVALLSPDEKMPFEIMPVVLSLKWQESALAMTNGQN